MLAAIDAFISQMPVRDKNRIAYETLIKFPRVLLCCNVALRSASCAGGQRGGRGRGGIRSRATCRSSTQVSLTGIIRGRGDNREQLELQWLQLSGEALKPVNGRGSLHHGTARGPYQWPDGKRRDTTKRAASAPRAKSRQRQGQRFRAERCT